MANILLAGTPQTTITVAQALMNAGHILVGVICPFPKQIGRKQIVTPCELEIWAVQHHTPVFHVDRTILQNKALELPPADMLVVADFGFLIPAWLLHHPSHGALNLHPSLLPRWRGAVPVPLTILAGDTETGITIMKMNEKFDEGAVVAQKHVEVLPDDTTPTLLTRAFEVGAQLLIEILPKYLTGTLQETPQPKDSLTPTTFRFTREDGFVPLEMLKTAINGKKLVGTLPLLEKYHIPLTVETLERMVRALTPWPGVWTKLPDRKRVKILETRIEGNQLKLKMIQFEGKTTERITNHHSLWSGRGS
ncbi:MAG TPA: hypothetical protein DCX25_03305 [Candidatus Pacebacteria bacterium]|nr:MAG: Methionyl-tRNA formyltransferase [Microgenomates group bacterium GW2011_GWB1_45_17]KKU24221.1 MAG: Methionyl-tRNA formyltransferase [Microgenomates group bacterium GW2011_GWC1_46_15]KKU24937.1 MAG: Methionyl-tRNA formyltransferase [Microgenomates group bacterium GW2011_GWA1_46_15]HAV15332.1 hypothetical protein [Candidatus Paceibacterota bacterium]HCR11396.1 hypothetical protein [Candidatus Paceibacterota bacterium]